MKIWRVILALPVLTLTAALGGCGWMSVSGPAATDTSNGATSGPFPRSGSDRSISSRTWCDVTCTTWSWRTLPILR